MADNSRASIGTQDGDTFAFDDIAGVKFARTKLIIGADGSNDGDISAANPLPVTGTVAVTNAGLTELAGAINASAQMDVNIAASGATVPVSNAGLTELAAAINASSQMDVNLAASGATVTVTGAGGTFPATDSGGSLTVDAPVGTPVFVRLSDGAAAIATLPVSLATVPSHAVTNAGTFAVQDSEKIVDDAAFTVATSKVSPIGGLAVACGADPDAADASDAAIPVMTRHRQLFTVGGHPNAKSATYIWTGATTDDNVLAAIAGGTKYAITRITITLDQATTVGVAVRLGFGTASVPALGAANADAVDDILFYHPGLVPGTMHTVGGGSGVLGVGADGAELRITAGATTGGTGVVTVTYFTLPS